MFNTNTSLKNYNYIYVACTAIIIAGIIYILSVYSKPSSVVTSATKQPTLLDINNNVQNNINSLPLQIMNNITIK